MKNKLNEYEPKITNLLQKKLPIAKITDITAVTSVKNAIVYDISIINDAVNIFLFDGNSNVMELPKAHLGMYEEDIDGSVRKGLKEAEYELKDELANENISFFLSRYSSVQEQRKDSDIYQLRYILFVSLKKMSRDIFVKEYSKLRQNCISSDMPSETKKPSNFKQSER